MVDTCITVTRNQLYERVWTVPLKILAAEFAISDVMLGKICRKNNIPLPGVGYWAKVKAGKPVHRTHLPCPTDNCEIRTLPLIEPWDPVDHPDMQESIRQLEQQVTTWQKCEMIRAYLKAVEKKAIAKYGHIEAGCTLDKWLKMGYDYARSFDPVPSVLKWHSTVGLDGKMDSNQSPVL